MKICKVTGSHTVKKALRPTDVRHFLRQPTAPFLKRVAHGIIQQNPHLRPEVATGDSSAACSGSVSLDGPSLSATWRSKPPPSNSPLARLKRFLFDDKQQVRERIGRYGLGAFAAYGLISNLNACVLATLACITVIRQTGLSPFATGQWPRFLAAYAALYVAASFIRPLRLSLAIALSPVFNSTLDWLEGVGKGRTRLAAFGVMLAMIATVSIVSMGVCIVVACASQGVYLLP